MKFRLIHLFLTISITLVPALALTACGKGANPIPPPVQNISREIIIVMPPKEGKACP